MSLLGRLFSHDQKSSVPNADVVQRVDRTPQTPDEVACALKEIAALSEVRRYAEIHALVSRALQQAPDHPQLLFAKASALLDTARFAEARELYERLDSAGYGSPSLAIQLARSCHSLGDFAAAEAALRKAISTDPGAFGPRYTLGALLQEWNRFEEAITELESAIASDRGHADARIAYGNALMELDRHVEAEAAYRQAVQLAPRLPSAWTNVGFSLMRQNRNGEAIESFRHAYELEVASGGDADAYINYAVALGDDGRDEDAIDIYENCLPARPVPKAHWNYAVSLLRSGRLQEGWTQQEFRWLCDPFLDLRPRYGVPMWCGQDLHGKTLVVRAEQGLGDTIQMLRFVPALAELGARVLLRAPPGFDSLALGVEGVAEVLKQGTTNPPFDYYIHAMSLPGVFGTTLTNIPADIPYVRTEPARVERWRARLGSTADRQVGLVWAGSSVHLKDRYRSILLESLSPLFSVEGIQFVFLQKGPAADEVGALRLDASFFNLGPELDDLADTAAVIEALDLVIGVDTAVMHLAGALARPAWTMIARPCDWRWLQDREDSPWYPTMRLFRQSKRNEWEDVIVDVRDALLGWMQQPETHRCQLVARPNVESLLAINPGPPRAVARPGICVVSEGRWGIVQYPQDGSDIALSLAMYGEWLEPQVRLLSRMLSPEDVIVEAGSGVGAHALAFATILRQRGRVYACEPDAVLRRVLRQNVQANGHQNVVIAENDPGCSAASAVDSVDAMGLNRVDLLKSTDPERSAAVLTGSAEVLWRARPKLFLAASDGDHLVGLAEHVKQFGYRCWRMETSLFNRENFNCRTTDHFHERGCLALLAIPEEMNVEMTLPGCEQMK